MACRLWTSALLMAWLVLLAQTRTATSLGNYKTTISCEGSQLKLGCDEGYKINLIRANFGRFSISICNDNGNIDWSVTCRSSKAFEVIQQECTGRRSCSLPASSALFGDPCPGTFKYLEAHYQCAPEAGYRPKDQSRSPPPIFRPNNKPHIPTTATNHHHSQHQQQQSAAGHTTRPTPPPIVIPSHSPHSPLHPQRREPEEISAGIGIASTTARPGIATPTRPHDILPPSPTLPARVFSHSEAPRVQTPKIGHQGSNPTPFAPTTSLLHDHCPPTYAAGINWSWTKINESSQQSCPDGASGNVRWSCAMVEGAPHWYPPEGPYFSECYSKALSDIIDRINGNEPFPNIANELDESTRPNPDGSSRLFAGDLVRIADIVSQLVLRMESTFELFFDFGTKTQMAKNFLESIQNVFSSVLDDSNLNAWFELSPMERKTSISSLMVSLERIVLQFAETQQIESEFIRAYNNLYISVHAKHTTSGAIVRDGLELPVVIDDQFGASTSDMRDQINSVYLSPQTLSDLSKGTLTKVIMLMYKKLDKLLMPDEPLTSGATSTVLNADIVTVLINNDHFPLLSPDSTGILINFKHKERAGSRLTNPRCVHWTPQRTWDSSGCSIKNSDPLHTICECDRFTSYGLLMDVLDVPQGQDAQNKVIFTNKPQMTNADTYNYVIAIGCVLAIVCFSLLLIIILLQISRNKEMKQSIVTELEVKKNLTLCLVTIEILFLLGINQPESKFLCGFIATMLHFMFLSMFIWLFFDGFTLYQALISDNEDSTARVNATLSGFLLARRSKPSKWYFILGYGVPGLVVAISLIINSSSYGTFAHCWLRNDSYFVLLFVGPMIAILSANFLFLAISFFIICRNCIASLLPSHKNTNGIPNARDENLEKAYLQRNRTRMLLMLLICVTWSMAIIHLNHYDNMGLGGDNALVNYSTSLFAIMNPIQAILILVIFVAFRDGPCRYGQMFKSLTKCFSRQSDVSGSSSGSESPEQAQLKYQLNGQEPMIPAPIANQLNGLQQQAELGSSNNYNCLPVEGSYRSSEYGFQANGEQRFSQCNQLYAPASLLVNTARRGQMNQATLKAANLRLAHNGQFPHIIEHVYECIDEDPYVAQLLLTNPNSINQHQLPGGIVFASGRNPNIQTLGPHLVSKLPAIIRDNTTHSIILANQAGQNQQQQFATMPNKQQFGHGSQQQGHFVAVANHQESSKDKIRGSQDEGTLI